MKSDDFVKRLNELLPDKFEAKKFNDMPRIHIKYDHYGFAVVDLKNETYNLFVLEGMFSAIGIRDYERISNMSNKTNRIMNISYEDTVILERLIKYVSDNPYFVENYAFQSYDSGIIGSHNDGNIAIKCNYCDGGHIAGHIGFSGVCSDKIIKHNIEVEHRVWCSNDKCPCFQYHNGMISRNELNRIMSIPSDLVCYESTTLSDWMTQAGLNEDGQTKSFGSTLHKGAVCVFTTRLPDMSEQNRFVFGIFLIDELFRGDSKTSGYVKCNSDYHIELSPDEAKTIKYWNYYRNKNHPEKEIWGTGLYRFMSNTGIIGILKDLISLRKGGEKDEVIRFLTEFCRLNGLKVPDINHSTESTMNRPIVSFPSGKTYDLVMETDVHAHPVKVGFPSKISPYLMVRATGGYSDALYEVMETLELNPMSEDEVQKLSTKYSSVVEYINKRKRTFGFDHAPLPYRFYMLNKIHSFVPAYVLDPNPQGFKYLSFEDVGLSKQVLSDERTKINDVEREQLEIENQNLERTIRDNDLFGTDRLAVVRSRVNQSAFRERLISKYHKCCLCGMDEEGLLIASHIKPWVDSSPEERVDDNNGLLLCPNHDKLFDRGLITFNTEGFIIISNSLSDNNRVFLNISLDDRIELDPQSEVYMKYHRDHIFRDGKESVIADVITTGETSENKTEPQIEMHAQSLTKKLGAMPNCLLNHEIYDVRYGNGKIVQVNSRTFELEVEFEDEEESKTFVFPDCFLSGRLSILNQEEQLELRKHLETYN